MYISITILVGIHIRPDVMFYCHAAISLCDMFLFMSCGPCHIDNVRRFNSNNQG